MVYIIENQSFAPIYIYIVYVRTYIRARAHDPSTFPESGFSGNRQGSNLPSVDRGRQGFS